MKSILLGVGALTWHSNERRSDRYGSVYLIDENLNSLSAEPATSLVDLRAADDLRGFKGRLLAKVLRIRKSTHVGDLHRKIKPRTPAVDAEIVLGEGVLFTENAPEGGIMVGLKPVEPRDEDWLNPRALYDAHEQTVELHFVVASSE